MFFLPGSSTEVDFLELKSKIDGKWMFKNDVKLGSEAV